MSHCPICNSDEIRERFSLYDDRYGFPGQFRLRTCHHCGHAYLENSSFSDQDIQRLYSDYYPRRRMDVERYSPHVDRSGMSAWLDGARASAFRWVPAGVKVLDIGSGFGEALGYHAARGCEVWGVESDENAERVAQRNGFNVRIGVFDPSDFPQDYFDVVTLDQVIEHMLDPVEALKGVRSVLKRGGFAILSTPNAHGWGANVFGRRWINWHCPYHLHFFSGRSMQIAAQRAGIEFRSLGTITPSDWLRYQWIHLVTMRSEGQVSPFWSGQSSFSTSERIAVKLARYLHFARINHLITRAFDAIGLGDSQLFELKKV